MNIYTADFETTTDENDCRVWAWCTCNTKNVNMLKFGNVIDTFIDWCSFHAPCQLYFHNLAFDGAFILDYLAKHEWEWIEDNTKAGRKKYTTLISEANQMYSITLYFDKNKHVKIYDSLKVIPLSVAQMAKAYKLEEGKGDLDYTSFREIGHELTDEEKEYIRRDVQIVAKVLREFLDEGLTKMTAGSNALYQYKKMLGGNRGFRNIYPVLDEKMDKFIRKAYRGGFTYVNPIFQGNLLGSGIVFDVNSLYPSVMASCDNQILPVGKPEWFEGEPKHIHGYPLWVAMVSCRFEIKKDHIPCIQLKGNFRFKQTEYLKRSGAEVTFTCTNIDWELINQQYDVKGVYWYGGFYFHANDAQFKAYVDKWVTVKNQATIDGNAGKRQIAKLMLNSLYGKFATRITGCSRMPELDEDGVVRYKLLEEESRESVYLPVGVFVTSHARYKTITSAQAVYDRFVYADTDSLHLVGDEIPSNLDVDAVRLGAWKHESSFTRAKFLRAKCYMEEIDGKEVVHVAGMPANIHKQVTFDNFNIGTEYYGKLYPKRVSGGIVLVPGAMKIRENL